MGRMGIVAVLGIALGTGCTDSEGDAEAADGGTAASTGGSDTAGATDSADASSGTGDDAASTGGEESDSGAQHSTGQAEDSESGGESGDASDELEAIIASIALDWVDPTGTDPSLAVGMVVVAIAGDEEGVFGFGAREIDGAPPDGDTHFSIASVSKVILGLAIAREVEDGQLALDTRVDDLLDDDLPMPTLGDTEITLEHLLTHYGGLPGLPFNRFDRDLDGILDGVDPMLPMAGYTREDFAVELGSYADGTHALVSPPGSQFLYSNHGNGTLNLILTDASGHADGEAALRALVFDPLGMDDTATHVEPFVSDALEGRAVGYHDPGDGTLTPQPFLDVGVFAGDVISTGHDLLPLLRAWIHPAQSPWPNAVERALVPLRPTGPGREIAYAIDVTNEPGLRRFAKGGHCPGYRAFLVFSHEPRAGVLVLTNNGSDASDARVPAFAMHDALIELVQ